MNLTYTLLIFQIYITYLIKFLKPITVVCSYFRQILFKTKLINIGSIVNKNLIEVKQQRYNDCYNHIYFSTHISHDARNSLYNSDAFWLQFNR